MIERIDRELTLWEHLAELIRRLRTILFSVLIASSFAMAFPLDFSSIDPFSTTPTYRTLTFLALERVKEDLLPANATLLPIDYLAPVTVYFYASLILGVLISLPVTAIETYRFIARALRHKEPRSLKWFSGSFTLLFLLGSLMGYVVIAPITLRILSGFTGYLGIPPVYELSSFYSIVFGLVLISGLVFTFPTLYVLLVKIGLLDSEFIARRRRHFYGGLFIALALLTPDPTLVSDLLLFVPLALLAEVATFSARRISRR